MERPVDGAGVEKIATLPFQFADEPRSTGKTHPGDRPPNLQTGPMKKKTATFEELKTLVGQELGVSDWVEIDQQKIDQFAECTGDRQWIHVDPERARKRSPFRTTIAHGYLTLSIIGALSQDMGIVPENTQAAFNYGLDRVRFIAPVKVGARIRMRISLISMEDVGPRQYLMKASNTIEIEGEEKPALIAETLVMLYEARKKMAAL
jgi:acyl dehydratase